jgi:C4-dicarboxylate transporter DctM subunit
MTGADMGTVAEQFLNGMYSNYIILAVPLFMLAAEFMNIGSMTERLLTFCNVLVGRFRGGLAQVNVVQSIIFAGMSGSAIADAAGSGKMMQNMMTKDGRYTPSYAAALTAVTSVIGPIIPPSIPMVIYALVSDASIGYLFLAGMVPGLLMAALQMMQVAITARRKNFPVEEAGAAARNPEDRLAGVSSTDDAGGAARLHLQRHYHADRSGRPSGSLCAGDLHRHLSQHFVCRLL